MRWMILVGLAVLLSAGELAAQLPTMQHPLPQKFREGKPDCLEVDLMGMFKRYDSTTATVRPVWSNAGGSVYRVRYYVNGHLAGEPTIQQGTKFPARQRVGGRLLDTLIAGDPFTFPHVAAVTDTLLVYVEPLDCSQSFAGGLYLIPEAPYDTVQVDPKSKTL